MPKDSHRGRPSRPSSPLPVSGLLRQRKHEKGPCPSTGVVETEALLTVLAVLALGLVTPGPNNVTCVVHAGVHGRSANVRLIAGMAVGFVVVHLVCGLLVQQVDEDGALWGLLHWFGLVFLALIAVRLFTLTPADVRTAMDGQGLKALVRLRDGGVPRLGFTTGVLMQFVNGKEWGAGPHGHAPRPGGLRRRPAWYRVNRGRHHERWAHRDVPLDAWWGAIDRGAAS